MNGQPTEPIKKNVKLELPIWLAEILAVCSLDQPTDDDNEEQEEDLTFITLIEPEFFSDSFLNFIKSNSLKLNLSSYNAYYYKIVTKWSYMFNDVELINLISKMLVERSCELNDLSFKLNDQFNDSNMEFLNSLDSFEKKLFKLSHESYKDFKNWWLSS